MRNSLIILFSSLVMFACSNDKAENKDNTSTADGHEHVYRCPMHPEVTGKEGDTCPKCGMKLVHSDEPTTANVGYFMQVAMNPTTVEPNKEVTLSFTPRIKGKESEAVALDIEHEKKIHLILVSDDLSWFDHIHPDYQADGSYTVKANFPAPGKYKAFADYKPTGAGHVVDKVDIDVKGTAPAAKSFGTDKLTGNSANYSFELKPTGGKLVTGALMHISGIVKKDGKQVDANSLDNYLGAKAHFVMISLNEKEYLHVHPSIDKGMFDLHTTFEKAGLYRGWVQFNADGRIHTIDFTLNVAEGSAEDIKNANQSHTDHHTGG
ncbi:MAG TPA: heavy metal-binding domain-containing protein [Flavisolibacter sp.]